VNMMLLATYMKKNNWSFEKGENGLVALQAFQNRLEGFDVIFMGIIHIHLPASLTECRLPLKCSHLTSFPCVHRCVNAHHERLRIDARDPRARSREIRKPRSGRNAGRLPTRADYCSDRVLVAERPGSGFR
jgi:hypothetical protein